MLAAVSAAEVVEARPARRSLRALRFTALLTTILALLFGVPWWTLIVAGSRWPTPVGVAGTAGFPGARVAFPVRMSLGHGRRHSDRAAAAGDTILGVIWVLCAWAVLGNLAGVGLGLAGVADPLRSRIVAAAVAAVSVVLVLWGYAEAMRVPRIRRVDVTLPRLGTGLNGVRVVLLTDTHYGPIDRARWSARVVDAVNRLDADIVCHTGDNADGSVSQLRAAGRGRRRGPGAGGTAAGPSAQVGGGGGGARGGPATVRAYPRRADLALPFPGPPGPADRAGADPARGASPALHQPGHRLLGTAVAGLRAERDHRTDTPQSMRWRLAVPCLVLALLAGCQTAAPKAARPAPPSPSPVASPTTPSPVASPTPTTAPPLVVPAGVLAGIAAYDRRSG